VAAAITPRRRELVAPDGTRARVRPWPDLEATGQLAVLAGPHGAIAGPTLRAWLELLRDDGWRVVRTGALARVPRQAFEQEGFEVCQELALLRLDLVHPPTRPPRSTVQAVRRHGSWRRRRTRIEQAAAVDAAAFGLGWRMEVDGIVDAAAATPAHRIGVVEDGGEVVAYAIAGRAGREGFLQRLAVHPDHQGRGMGRALALDALRWLGRHGASSVLVNTHVDNVVALGLYADLGFRRLPDGLVVLERRLDDGSRR
jgi:ribosomal protein S18 acetylase RimI-like enzyme